MQKRKRLKRKRKKQNLTTGVFRPNLRTTSPSPGTRLSHPDYLGGVDGSEKAAREISVNLRYACGPDSPAPDWAQLLRNKGWSGGEVTTSMPPCGS